MSITKSVGKNTLGDGDKMKVHMRTYDRSTNNMGYAWRSSMTVGTLVPFICEYVQTGDTWELDMEAKVLTHPTVGPLFGSFKLQGDVFVCPIRLYQGWLHNNKLGIGMDMAQIKLPVMSVAISGGPEDYPTQENQFTQIHPSSLLPYLGLRGWGSRVKNSGGIVIEKQCVPTLGYWDIFKNFYANKQEKEAYYIDAIPETYRIRILNNQGVQKGVINNPVNGQRFDPAFAIVTGDVIEVTDTTEEDLKKLIFGYIYTTPSPVERTTGYAVDLGSYIIDANGKALINVTNRPWGNTGNVGIREIVQVVQPSFARLEKFPLENLDKMREDILYWNNATAFKITEETYKPYGNYVQRKGEVGTKLKTSSPLNGLALKTYQSDIFNNWINTEWIDKISMQSAVAVVNNAITMDALSMAKKIYDYLNRIAISGGTFQNWLEVSFPSSYFQRTETPTYEGGFASEVIFQEVLSNAATENEPLGSLAGRGIDGKQKGGRVKVRIDEPSYIIGLVSLTPRLDYNQGNRYDVEIKTLDDFHKPALDGIGFQDLTTDRMFWGEKILSQQPLIAKQRAIGKQPAWIDYKTNYNRTYGNFALNRNEAFMVLNRNYTIGERRASAAEDWVPAIMDPTTYIDPSKFNYIFADQSLNAQNFWVQIRVGAKVRRLISASLIPNV